MTRIRRGNITETQIYLYIHGHGWLVVDTPLEVPKIRHPQRGEGRGPKNCNRKPYYRQISANLHWPIWTRHRRSLSPTGGPTVPMYSVSRNLNFNCSLFIIRHSDIFSIRVTKTKNHASTTPSVGQSNFKES